MLMKTKFSSPMKTGILLFISMTLMMMMIFKTFNNSLSLIMEVNLVNYTALTLSVPINIDKISLIFSMTVLTISLSVMCFSTSYMSSEKNLEYFIIMVMMFVFSMNILIFIPNLVMLLLGWDGLGLTSYLLVIYYNNNKSLSAGMITALTNRIGDALLILAISWALMAGHWNFSFSSFSINVLITTTIIIAAMTKSAQMPFSAWLPAAMAAPTPVSALVHSSTLVTAGVYLIIRFFPTLSNFEMMKFLCFYMGALTCLMASTSAMVENDLKKIIALSTLSQLGIMMMALGLEMPLLAFFHLITHALFKALLFICAGNIIAMQAHNQDIRLMGNIANTDPINIVMMNSANLSLCGMPFLAGFYSKDAIVESFFIANLPISTSMILMSSVCLTSAYTMRLSITSLWNQSKNQNFTQSKSKSTFLAYLILLPGAIMGGAMMNWLFQPMIITPTLPKALKMLTFILIMTFAIIMYNTINKKMGKKISNFLSSMWFLTSLSSNFISNISMEISGNYIYNEVTWMEKISGKGVNSILSLSSMSMQNVNKINISELLTMMSFVIILIYLI